MGRERGGGGRGEGEDVSCDIASRMSDEDSRLNNGWNGWRHTTRLDTRLDEVRWDKAVRTAGGTLDPLLAFLSFLYFAHSWLVQSEQSISTHRTLDSEVD